MKKKSNAQIYLEQVAKLDIRIENKLIEIQQWQDIAKSITACMGGERVQSSGSQSKMADAVIACLAAEDEIHEQVNHLVAKKKDVAQTIERLYNPMEYKLLHMRYIQHISLSDIADKLGKEYGWARTTHGRALKHVKQILEERNAEANL